MLFINFNDHLAIEHHLCREIRFLSWPGSESVVRVYIFEDRENSQVNASSKASVFGRREYPRTSRNVKEVTVFSGTEKECKDYMQKISNAIGEAYEKGSRNVRIV